MNECKLTLSGGHEEILDIDANLILDGSFDDQGVARVLGPGVFHEGVGYSYLFSPNRIMSMTNNELKYM